MYRSFEWLDWSTHRPSLQFPQLQLGRHGAQPATNSEAKATNIARITLEALGMKRRRERCMGPNGVDSQGSLHHVLLTVSRPDDFRSEEYVAIRVSPARL